jgi:hypothetical protein
VAAAYKRKPAKPEKHNEAGHKAGCTLTPRHADRTPPTSALVNSSRRLEAPCQPDGKS